MINDFLTEDTKAIILLCGFLGKNTPVKPLSLAEYSLLVYWLISTQKRPRDLLQKDTVIDASLGTGINKSRLEVLLGRGIQLGFAVEEWQRSGLWVLSRSDADYPERYKKHLKDKAPPLLFGAGSRSLLRGGGLGIVGSRSVDHAGEAFTRHVAELCAYNHMPVVSGGARGVDQISMSAALEAGGVVVGILAEALLKKSIERNTRQAIADGRLLLLSPYHPNARFSVGTAMGRNKLIYALSDYGLVVSAEHKKGGTWAGAEEELKRENALPVFVRTGSNTPAGNSKLMPLGAIPWPDSIERDDFKQQLRDLAVSVYRSQPNEKQNFLDTPLPIESSLTTESLLESKKIDERPISSEQDLPVQPEGKALECPTSIYHAALPLLIDKLDSPTTVEELVETLDVNKAQLNVWLQRAVKENRVTKLSKPVRYQRAESEEQVYLWQ